jgi:hypothetical protein
MATHLDVIQKMYKKKWMKISIALTAVWLAIVFLLVVFQLTIITAHIEYSETIVSPEIGLTVVLASLCCGPIALILLACGASIGYPYTWDHSWVYEDKLKEWC